MSKFSRLMRISMVGLLVILPACASKTIPPQPQQPPAAPAPAVVEKPAPRPAWVEGDTFAEDDRGLYMVAAFMGGADYTMTLRLAKAEAMKNLLESVEVKARGEFSSAMHGGNRQANDIGRYVTDTVGWVVENLRVRGVRQRQVYVEQASAPGANSAKYNAWVRVEISKADYEQARLDAANRLLAKAVRDNDAEVKERACKLLEQLKEAQ